MKKTTFLVCLLMVVITTIAQDHSLVFNEKKLVWCGVDFSNARLIGSDGFSDVEKIKNYFFDNWNQLIVTEADKYNFKKYYNKDEQINELEVAEERNEMPNI